MTDGLSIKPPPPPVDHAALMELITAPEGPLALIARHEKAKSDAQQALSDLKLGKTAQEAREEALLAHQSAMQMVGAAIAREESAKESLESAKRQAAGIIDTAQRKADEIRTLAAQEHAQHDLVMAAYRAQLDAKSVELDAQRAAAKSAQAAADKAMGAAVKAQADADKAMADAKAKLERHKAKLAKAKAELDD